MSNQETYNQFVTYKQKIADINHTLALLQWDQQVNLPKDGAAHRARQISTLAGISHELSTSNDLGELLEKLSSGNSLDVTQSANVREAFIDYKKATKLPVDFVQRHSAATSKAFQSWSKAKTNNDFNIYQDDLQRIIDLKREEAHLKGFEDHPYDALMNDYEANAKTKDITELFVGVKSFLVDLVKEISEQTKPDSSFLSKKYEEKKQWDFGIELLKQMRYDFNSGRQDISIHPFTTTFSPKDVRVTTHINENFFPSMTWGTIHEGGHALYEQGLPVDQYGLPGGEAVSLGIHESQSRLWENNVGRSLPYWKGNYSKLQAVFPNNLSSVSLENFYKAINKVQPSFIRIEADELTYHFHILVRFELEKAIIEGNLDAKDLSEAWNAKYKEYLNIDVPSDDIGVMQDIHWSHGSMGYFPTYSLGSFYAAQFYAKAKEANPNLEEEIERGEMQNLLNWLRSNIHQHGRTYSAETLCERVTGEKLNFEYFKNYVKEKYGNLYSL